MSKKGNLFSFVGAAFALIATYITSAVPIPLYGIYQTADHIGYVELSLSSVVYFIGAVTALVVFGRLSNHLGRKPVAVISLLLAALSTLFFLNVHSAAPLLLGRLCQGLACGLASTALASWVVDCAFTVRAWIAPAILSCGPMTGLTIGGLGSGALTEYGPIPRQLPFYVVLAVLLVCLLFVLRSQETMAPKSGAMRSLKPNFALPPSAKKAFPLAACTFVCTWALGGFFQAFGPAMAREQLHSTSAVAAALVFASIMAPSSIGASLAGKMSSKRAQFAGMLSFTLFVGCILFTLSSGLLIPFLIASVLAGIAQGMVLTGSIQTMVSELTADERANVLSVIYATSYMGAAVPTLIAGQFSEHFSLLQVAGAYGVLALLGSVILIAAKLKQKSAGAITDN
ncbi:MFS transporter [Vibrio sp. AK197]|uniref:MFS transporter n=1 Tax=Vibrio olivae TaxID=1243002 RepID=A0ABV5HHY3_9VIBR